MSDEMGKSNGALCLLILHSTGDIIEHEHKDKYKLWLEERNEKKRA